MNNRNVYDSAFHIFRTQQKLCEKFESLGFNFEYGQGAVGIAFDNLISETEVIILECLGLTTSRQINKKCAIAGTQYPVKIDVFYCEDMNDVFAITADDFSEFFFKAVNNDELQDLMWKAIAERNISAREQYNELKIGTIGISHLI